VGNLIAAVHALSALVVVFLLYFLIRGVFSARVEEANRYIQLVSFALITALGAFMLVRRARGAGHHHHGEATLPTWPVSVRTLLGIAVPAGLIPCPGAIAVILFALSLQMLGVSILSVVSMSAGMGVTISVAGAIAILVKGGAIKAFAGGHEERGAAVRRVLEIAGAAILFLLGLILFLVQLL
jgi:ABC-type nickel/cobalt efflux system permease component RcnA